MQTKARVRVVSEPTSQSRQLRVRRMSLMNIRAGDRAGTGVEIFVGTPHREIDVPIVQRERNIADRVRKIDTDGDATFLRGLRDGWNVEQLAGEKIHARNQH